MDNVINTFLESVQLSNESKETENSFCKKCQVKITSSFRNLHNMTMCQNCPSQGRMRHPCTAIFDHFIAILTKQCDTKQYPIMLRWYLKRPHPTEQILSFISGGRGDTFILGKMVIPVKKVRAASHHCSSTGTTSAKQHATAWAGVSKRRGGSSRTHSFPMSSTAPLSTHRTCNKTMQHFTTISPNCPNSSKLDSIQSLKVSGS